jgi:hypothetical protein
MKAVFQAVDPNKTEYRMTLVMTLEDWKALRGELSEKWPAWQLTSVINAVVSQAERTYYAEHEVHG